ncbi:MAG: hypothetical protein KKD31_02880 [Bacteroidetes bacterium]|nr:hypothetical protein [Bacteroidota bacterium]
MKLIEDSRNRVFQKVNEELVLLYFNVGNIVSDKVAAGVWGENTVDELVTYIERHYPGLKGFNRRGLYRMKQFYEVYSSDDFVLPIATQLEIWVSTTVSGKNLSAQVSNSVDITENVSAVRSQKHDGELLKKQVLDLILAKVNWTNHRLILSKTNQIPN